MFPFHVVPYSYENAGQEIANNLADFFVGVSNQIQASNSPLGSPWSRCSGRQAPIPAPFIQSPLWAFYGRG